MFASLALLALAASPSFAVLQYNLYNNGSRGSVTGYADDFGATYHTSAFMSRQGCSSTAKITYCYTADLAADPKKELETKDYKPYLAGGVGEKQRALLLSEPHFNATGVVTHKVRFHISTSYTNVPLAGVDKEVTFVGMRNFNQSIGLRALDVRARTFTGEETSGTFLYVAAVDQSGSEAFPTSYPLKSALGKTIEVTYKLGINGATVDSAGVYVADVTAKFVDTGAKLFTVTVTKTLFPKGVVDKQSHRLIFGANRKASTGQKELKVWFGDYSASPLPYSPPE
ncbi:hypothetical protein EXIGLDRAFT_722727, partial [Exidia glandulosa HHB12029]